LTGHGLVKALETDGFTYGLHPTQNKMCIECGRIIPAGHIFLISPQKEILHQVGDCEWVAKLLNLSPKEDKS
jgi:hypothetical protein